MLRKLRDIWSHSDSQPTEITLALINLTLTQAAVGIEIGGLYIFRIVIFVSAIYQLFCVGRDKLNCRVRASVLTFSVFLITLVMYFIYGAITTPSHYGWFVLVFASFGSMRRLILEKVHILKRDG